VISSRQKLERPERGIGRSLTQSGILPIIDRRPTSAVLLIDQDALSGRSSRSSIAICRPYRCSFLAHQRRGCSPPRSVGRARRRDAEGLCI